METGGTAPTDAKPPRIWRKASFACSPPTGVRRSAWCFRLQEVGVGIQALGFRSRI